MKKSLIIIFIIVFAAISFSTLLGEPPEAAEKKPQAPKAVKRIDTMLAVFDLETTGKIDKDVSRPLTDSIRLEVVKTKKYKIIDRSNMDKILGEQKLQLSGCVSGECIVEAGQLLGVGRIITGSISLIGSTYYLSLSLINVESGEIEKSSEDKCKCELDELIDSSKRLIAKLIGESIGSPVKEQTSKSFSLEELEQNMKRDKAEWDKKTEDMKLAYNKVLEKEGKHKP